MNMKAPCEPFVAERAWTPAERRVVWHGFFGRLSIAIEPMLGAIVFLLISVGLMLRKNMAIVDRAVIASIFILGFFAFLVYAIWLMASPTRALLQTRRPIYIIDGYVRYRGPDDFSDEGSCGYVAVLYTDRSVAHEWPAFGGKLLAADMFPALVEYSAFGGVHRIDGRSTGVVPDDFKALGIGLAANIRQGEIRRRAS